jgi:predicted nucleic acid-binding protein
MIIANATPLIYLHRIGRLELLHQLFTQMTIPAEVARELQMGNTENQRFQTCRG